METQSMGFSRWLSQRHLSRMRKAKLTRNVLFVETLEDRLCLSARPLGTPPTSPDANTQAQAGAAYSQLPMSFEANQGQTDAAVNFLSRGSGYALFLSPGEAVLSLQKPNLATADASESPNSVLRMQLVGAKAAAQVTGLDALPGTSNYLNGIDPSQWHTNIPNYGRVKYQDVYPGIDVVYYGNQRQLEYDFIVAPGANTNDIQLSFQGALNISLDSQGNLIVHTAGGDVVEQAPVLYQQVGTGRQTVSGHYNLEGNGRVGFTVGAYDPSRQLIIDPLYSLVYSTYLGGKTGDDGYGIAVDSAGSAYIIGDTTSSNYPIKNPLQSRLGSQNDYDVYVAKLNPAGTALVYSTYLGGKGFDVGEGIAVDSAGNAYLTGTTGSTDFPTTKNAFHTSSGGSVDAFVAKLNAAGSALLYSTYLGGSGRDLSHAIAVDGSGKVYVTGETASANFPMKNALQPNKISPQNSPDAYVAKFDLSLVGAASLVYSTFLDGGVYSVGLGIAVDGPGNAFVTGRTGSGNFPTTAGVYQSVFAGGDDAFVTKLNPAGSALVYSTFLGGSDFDAGYGIAVDVSGNAYVTGRTSSSNFLPVGYAALQPVLNGYTDAFVTKLNADGSALIYATYLGGSGTENQTANPRAGGIAVDALGNAFVTGNTDSTDFHTTVGVFQTTFGGGQYDAFVAELNPAGSEFVYSTYLGGNSMEQVFGIAIDSTGNTYVTGTTTSANFPTKNPLQPKYGGGSFDGFVTKIDPPAAAGSRQVNVLNVGDIMDDSVTRLAMALLPTRTAPATTLLDQPVRNDSTLLTALLAAGPGLQALQIEPVHNTASIGRKDEFAELVDSSPLIPTTGVRSDQRIATAEDAIARDRVVADFGSEAFNDALVDRLAPMLVV
jgi:hypothetical protein